MNKPGLRDTIRQLLKTAAVLLAATGCSLSMASFGIGSESIIMVFLLGVLFTNIFTQSYIYGIITSVLGLVLFNYFFTEPKLTFVVASTSDIILLLFFLVTAVVCGMVASRLKQQIELSNKNGKTAHTLYQIASGFGSVNGKANIIHRAIGYIKDYTGCPCSVIMDNGEAVSSDDTAAESYNYRDFDIQGAAQRLGSLRIYGKTDEQMDMTVTAVAMQLGIALSREELRLEQENIRIAMERERQRSIMLRSVAHDLRTPLTALSGASNLLADKYDSLTDLERKKFASDISEESLWLSNLVENILNMTRIGDQQLELYKQFEVVDDLLTEAVRHSERLLKNRRFKAELPKDIVMVPVDGKLIVQVIINLLENAVRHTPQEAEINLYVNVNKDNIEITVADTGNGIPTEIESKLFDRFVTLDRGITDGHRGLGLGLAICKAIAEAHGGSIEVRKNEPHGAAFTLTLPLEEQA